MIIPPLAVKSLTASDLTFFRWHFENLNAGNQKAINLNANVFVDRLFPSLPTVAAVRRGVFPLDLFIYGPGLFGEHNLQRKIVKHGTYKNWRLNGEFVSNPPEAMERFNVLQTLDYVVLDFGEHAQTHPTTLKAVFLARAEGTDASLHAALAEQLGDRSMAAVSRNDLARLVDRAGPADSHPIRELLLESAMEDAVQGGEVGARRLLTRRSGRRISRADLQGARDRVEIIGRLGEAFVDDYLRRQVEGGLIEGYTWESELNAVHPFDFTARTGDQQIRRIEVKSTGGEFTRPFHMSLAEMLVAAEEDPYSIYRVFELDEERARLRVASNVGPLVRRLLDVFAGLPTDVRVDAVSISPHALEFGATVELSRPADPEDEE